MAKQIEGVAERILSCAKAEFLDKGEHGCIPAHHCGGGRNQHQLDLRPLSGQRGAFLRHCGEGTQ